MTSKHLLVSFLALCCTMAIALEAPDRLSLNKHRIGFRDLGQQGSNLIEPDDSKITSLAVDPTTGRIYGGTSGKRAQIFAFEPSTNHLRPLGFLPEGNGVRNAAVVGPDGTAYFGTGLDMTLPQPLSSDWGRELGNEHIVKKMWADIEAFYGSYPGGHIYRFAPKAGTRRSTRPIRRQPSRTSVSL